MPLRLKDSDMTNLHQLLQHAQKLQGRVSEMQHSLEKKRIEGISGGGIVRAVVNGKQEVLEIRIDKNYLDPQDIEMTEELITAAVNNAMEKSRKMMGEEMSKITGGIALHGIISNLLGE